jgi:hypothetical protein
MKTPTYEQKSIGKENAIRLYESGWWKGKTARDITQFQLFTAELCLPFGDFHQALEESLGRSVFTHELGLNLQGLIGEFMGTSPAPTLEQIINLIPEEKRILIQI